MGDSDPQYRDGVFCRSEKHVANVLWMEPVEIVGRAEVAALGLQPEYRHWFCQPFNGWFVGVHLMGGEFNIGEVKLPFGLFKELRDRRYEGWFAGGGITGGYQWMLSEHWNLEASLGLGYDYIRYDKFACGYCGEILKSSHRHYFGPTKLALSFIYIF